MFFGGSLSNYSIKDSISIMSKTKSQWVLPIEQIQLNAMKLGKTDALLTSSSKQMKMPDRIFKEILAHFITTYECVDKNNKIFCPCESGKP